MLKFAARGWKTKQPIEIGGLQVNYVNQVNQLEKMMCTFFWQYSNAVGPASSES